MRDEKTVVKALSPDPTIGRPVKIVYDRTTCGRCLGSGEYSYNHIDGTRCYGCLGSGTVLTKRAKTVKNRVTKLRRKLCAIRSDDVVAGDLLRLSGWTAPAKVKSAIFDFDSSAYFMKVTLNEVECSFRVPYISFTFTNSKTGYGVCEGTMMELAPTGERWAAMVKYASKYVGDGCKILYRSTEKGKI